MNILLRSSLSLILLLSTCGSTKKIISRGASSRSDGGRSEGGRSDGGRSDGGRSDDDGSSISSGGPCHLPIDIAFLQDVTGSFRDDLPKVAAQLPSIIEMIQLSNPGSMFSIASFTDKPYMPFGESNSICYKLSNSLSNDTDEIVNSYNTLRAGGGGDLPESQYTALINLALDKNVKWRELEYNTTDPLKAGARLILMSTDAVPHIPKDYLLYDPIEYPDLPLDLPEHWGGFTQDNPLNECNNYDYPSPYQVENILKNNQITLGILTPNKDDKVVGAWKWVNEELLQQSSNLYRFIEEDSSDIKQAIIQLVQELTSTECQEQNHTTEEVTTITEDVTTTTEEQVSATTEEQISATTEEQISATTEDENHPSNEPNDSTHIHNTDTISTTQDFIRTPLTTIHKSTTHSIHHSGSNTVRTGTTATTEGGDDDCECAKTCPEPVCHCDCCHDEEEKDISGDEGLFSGFVPLALKDINLKEVMLLAVPRNPKALRVDYN